MTIKKGNLSCMVIEFHMGDVLDENDNFNVWKPIIHGYTNLHGGDLNENGMKKDINIDIT